MCVCVCVCVCVRVRVSELREVTAATEGALVAGERRQRRRTRQPPVLSLSLSLMLQHETRADERGGQAEMTLENKARKETDTCWTFIFFPRKLRQLEEGSGKEKEKQRNGGACEGERQKQDGRQESKRRRRRKGE